MDANFAKLEALARQQGTAIGMASDLPDSVEKLARYAKTAAAHGIALVPLSAAVRFEAQAQNTQANTGLAGTTRVFRAQ
jgi:hypothetical protein